MAKLSAAEVKKIAAMHAEIQCLGTPEKGYTDSGFWKFLNYVYTKDSHDSDKPVKRLMSDDVDYLKVVFLFMLACPVLAIPKSRQIRMSWAAVSFALWHAMSRPHRRVTFQTKKEEDAHDMITFGSKNPAAGRCDFVLQHLPGWLRDPHVASGGGNRAGAMVMNPLPTDASTGAVVPWAGSLIEAVPQGADQVRGKTPSLYISDEAAFQDAFGDAVVALRPAVTGGGRFIAVSSVDAGSHFNNMVLEGVGGSGPAHRVPEAVQTALDIIGMEWPHGMKSWETPSGVWVLETHYTADPHKDPEREGAAWFAEAQKGYIGGVESPGWKTEMEIDYNAGGGDPVFPFAVPGSPIFIDGFEPSKIMETHRFYAGYDYGARNPSAFIVWSVDADGKAYAVWEVYEPCLDIGEHVAKIKRCPYWDRIEYVMCDPSITAKNQQTASGVRSLSEQFAEYGFYISPGRRGADVPAAHLFLSRYWENPQEPKAFITKACPNLWKEVRDLRWAKHVSAGVAQRKNDPERIRDKDNHAWDATAYVMDSGLQAFVPAARPKPGAKTFGHAAEELRMIISNERRRSGGIQI